jgi:hypothetical protein
MCTYFFPFAVLPFSDKSKSLPPLAVTFNKLTVLYYSDFELNSDLLRMVILARS